MQLNKILELYFDLTDKDFKLEMRQIQKGNDLSHFYELKISFNEWTYPISVLADEHDYIQCSIVINKHFHWTSAPFTHWPSGKEHIPQYVFDFIDEHLKGK